MGRPEKLKITRMISIIVIFCVFMNSFDIETLVSVMAEDTEIEKLDEEETEEIRIMTEVNDTVVTMIAPPGAFPGEGEITLQVEEIIDDRLEQARTAIENTIVTENVKLDSCRLFDIIPVQNGKEVQPVKPVKIIFHNLCLKGEDGTVIDVTKELGSRPYTEENPDSRDTEEGIKLYHFASETEPEEILPEAGEEGIITEFTHFSWVLAGDLKNSGQDYTWNFEDEGGAYTLDYILNHYNVFVSGDYLGSHVVGPMVVGGDARGSAFGGYSHIIEGESQLRSFPHPAPSYFEGYVHRAVYEEDTSIPNIKTDRTDLPVYLGRHNFEGFPGREEKFRTNSAMPYYTTPAKAYNPDGTYNYGDMYVDFQKVFPTDPGLPGRNMDPPGKVSDDRPKDHHDQGITGRYEWLNGTTDGVVNVSNDGLLYGSKDMPGTINYYRDFNGYDESGNKVVKINITDDMIQDLLDISNRLSTGTSDSGYSKYYDSNGQEIKVLENLPSETVRNRPEYSDYAFAIDTKHVNKTDGVYKKVSLRFKPGSNFIFESMDKITNLIYDYKTPEDLKGNLTILQTTQKSERLVIPSTYKSGENDIYGKTNEFGSIEGDEDFSTVIFAPYVEQVYAGYKDPDTAGGPGLTGHLVVPQADVWITGGNYNGCIIARNVDARGTEGHMWRFKTKALGKGLEISGNKKIDGRVNGMTPEFTFKAVITDDETGTSKEYFTANRGNGEFSFLVPPQDLLLGKSYTITISEEDLKEEQKGVYQKDAAVYTGKFTVTGSSDSFRDPIRVDWKVFPEGDLNGQGNPVTSGEIVFNNTTKQNVSVDKIWKDEEGKIIENGEGCPTVQMDLYRTDQATPGHTVKLQLYSGYDTYSCKMFMEKDLGQVQDGKELSLTVNCLDQYYWAGIYATAGIDKVLVNDVKTENYQTGGLPSVYDNKWSQCTINRTVNEDLVISVYYSRNAAVKYGTKPDGAGNPTQTGQEVPSEDMFCVSTENTQWAEPVFEPLEAHWIKTITLNSANGFHEDIQDLQSRDSKGNPYYYKIVEKTGRYDTVYNNQIFTIGENGAAVTVTNIKKAPVLTSLGLDKKDIYAPEGSSLEGAEFILSDVEHKELYFTKDKHGVYHPASGEDQNASRILRTSSKGKNKGRWQIQGIPAGTYYLQEIKAPVGYKIEKDEITIVLNEDKTAQIFLPVDRKMAEIQETNGGFNITFFNSSDIELPVTGGKGNCDVIILAGCIAMLSGIFMFVSEQIISKRRGKKEKM